MRALVTGATSGIGYEIAKELANRNIDLYLASRDTERMNDLKKEFSNVDVKIFQIDLSIPESSFDLFNKIKSDDVKINILINNSGFGLFGDFFSRDIKVIYNLLQLNIVSLTILTRLFSEQMALNGGGYIMNVASTAAFQPIPYFGIYAASKSFVRNFSLSIHHELKEKNVVVTCLNPGPTKSNFFKTALHEQKSQIFSKKISMMPDVVAKSALEALFAGKQEITTGLLNKIYSKLLRFVPVIVSYLVVKRFK